MKKYIITLFIFFQCNLCMAQDIDLLWKARAIKAVENIETLQKEMKNELSLELRFKSMLEHAYTAIFTTPDITVKETQGTLGYHLILNFGKDDGLLDVVYTYRARTYEYLGVRIDLIPKNRSLLLMNNIQLNDFLIFGDPNNINEPAIIFSKSNPFGAFVVDLDELLNTP